MFYLFGKELIGCLSRAFRENSELTLILRAHVTKSCMSLSSVEIFEAFSTNSVDPDQTTPVGAV